MSACRVSARAVLHSSEIVDGLGLELRHSFSAAGVVRDSGGRALILAASKEHVDGHKVAAATVSCPAGGSRGLARATGYFLGGRRVLSARSAGDDKFDSFKLPLSTSACNFGNERKRIMPMIYLDFTG
jgi:hypothetical protein